MKPSWATAFQGWHPIESDEIIQEGMKWVDSFEHKMGRLTQTFVKSSIGYTFPHYKKLGGSKLGINEYSAWVFRKGPKEPTISTVASVPLALP